MVKHKLLDIDIINRTANCSICGNVKIYSSGKNTAGDIKWKCSVRLKKENRIKQTPWSEYKKDYCEICGFVAKNKCQLDVDHIDGNNNNNDISNYQTLCANCHRLKTWENKDWLNKK
jgi:hypothetical protein